MRLAHLFLLHIKFTSRLPLGVTVQGKSVQITSGDSALSAIDTGTTLIGGPSDDVKTIWAAVPGSQALAGNMEGFYGYRTSLFPTLIQAVHDIDIRV